MFQMTHTHDCEYRNDWNVHHITGYRLRVNIAMQQFESSRMSSTTEKEQKHKIVSGEKWVNSITFTETKCVTTSSSVCTLWISILFVLCAAQKWTWILRQFAFSRNHGSDFNWCTHWDEKKKTHDCFGEKWRNSLNHFITQNTDFRCGLIRLYLSIHKRLICALCVAQNRLDSSTKLCLFFQLKLRILRYNMDGVKRINDYLHFFTKSALFSLMHTDFGLPIQFECMWEFSTQTYIHKYKRKCSCELISQAHCSFDVSTDHHTHTHPWKYCERTVTDLSINE